MPYVEDAPALSDVLGGLGPEELGRRLPEIYLHREVAPAGNYRHWNTLRHLTPPGGLTHKEWWASVKFARGPLLRDLPLTDPAGNYFAYCTPDQVQELLHFIDQQASGSITMPELVTADGSARQRFIVNSLIEESIRSSQLEGATTTRLVAKEMIRSGRQPRDRSEQMIVNNYRAMEFIRSEVAERLTPELVLTLHRIITEGTLDDPADAGRLQQEGEPRVGVFEGEEQVHRPPPAAQLSDRLEAMCAFANEERNPTGFLHPVMRSVLLHFWLAYDHPFVDGNGRTARILFYWSMKKHGYWLTEYLSISRIFREAPSKYGEAFLLTEKDERDTTYFVLHHLEAIKRAIEEAHEYLQRKMQEVREVESFIRGTDEYNYRQLALLGDAIRNPSHRYTFRSHAVSHDVAHQTARMDLLSLVDRGLLTLRRVGRRFVFSPSPDIADRVRSDGEDT
jgi:Fic family protein